MSTVPPVSFNLFNWIRYKLECSWLRQRAPVLNKPLTSEESWSLILFQLNCERYGRADQANVADALLRAKRYDRVRRLMRGQAE